MTSQNVYDTQHRYFKGTMKKEYPCWINGRIEMTLLYRTVVMVKSKLLADLDGVLFPYFHNMKGYTQEEVDLIVQQEKNRSYIEGCKATEAIYRDMFAKAKEEQGD